MHLHECFFGPGFDLGLVAEERLRTGPDVLIGVIPVEDSCGIGEVGVMNRPAPVASIGREDFFLGFAINAAEGESVQTRTELFGTLPSPENLLVPVPCFLLPVDATDTHLLLDQAVLSGVLGVRFPLLRAGHDAIATDERATRLNFGGRPLRKGSRSLFPELSIGPTQAIRFSPDLMHKFD